MWLDPVFTPQQPPEGVDQLYAALEYDDVSSRLIERVKYQFFFAYTKLFAQLIWIHHGKQLQKQKHVVLIPVPLHRKRQLWRGFNQAEKLAKQLGVISGWLTDTRRLKRTHFQHTQASSNRHERQQVNDDYKCRGRLSPAWTYCLVDDVVTTGATLTACALALRSAGATKVIAITLAQTL